MIDIRSYREADFDEVCRLWDVVFPDPKPHNAPATVIKKKRQVQRELFWVAVKSDRVVGTVMAGYDGHRGWIYALAVLPEHRKQGIGKSLMKHAETQLVAIGCTKVNLQVRTGNEEVVSVYQKLGYDIEDRVSMGKLIGRSSHRVE